MVPVYYSKDSHALAERRLDKDKAAAPRDQAAEDILQCREAFFGEVPKANAIRPDPGRPDALGLRLARGL